MSVDCKSLTFYMPVWYGIADQKMPTVKKVYGQIVSKKNWFQWVFQIEVIPHTHTNSM